MSSSSVFAGEVTLVTGGGSGIGARLCKRIVAPGRGIVVHTGSNREKAENVAAELRAAGATAHVIVAKFDHPHVGEAMVKETIERFGRLDSLVHLAAKADATPIGPLTAEKFEQSLLAPAKGFLGLVTAALPDEIARDATRAEGHHGQRGLARAHPQGSRPAHDGDGREASGARTPEHSHGPLWQAGGSGGGDRVPALLLSEEASYITGHVLAIDGGISL